MVLLMISADHRVIEIDDMLIIQENLIKIYNIKKYLDLLSKGFLCCGFSSSLTTKCISSNNKPHLARSSLTDLDLQELIQGVLISICD